MKLIFEPGATFFAEHSSNLDMHMINLKKIISLPGLLLALSSQLSAQTVTGGLHFEQGQTISIKIEMKNTMVQQAMGQSIDFSAGGQARHQYAVTNQTSDNSTLHHTIQGIRFSFDGMGAKKTFDSDKSSDLQSNFGKPIREWLKQSYDMLIDTLGKTRLVQPPNMPALPEDDQVKFVTGLLTELTDIVKPPARNEASFFAILPAGPTAIGDSWTQTGKTPSEEWSVTYTLTAVTDTAIVVALKGISNRQQQTDMRGMTVTTQTKSLSTGTILLDPASKLIRRKTIQVESSGTAEMMGNSTPVSSKTTIVIDVSSQL